jgi:UDP-N-acetylglucosamine 3-dehydrogenase
MIHNVDLTHPMARSDVVEGHSMSRDAPTAEADFASAPLRFAGGMVTTITASRVSQNKVRRLTLTQQVEVHRIEYAEYLDEGGLRYRHAAMVEIPFLSQHGEPLMHELRHFAKNVLTRSRPRVNGEDGRAELKIRLAMRDAENAE